MSSVYPSRDVFIMYINLAMQRTSVHIKHRFRVLGKPNRSFVIVPIAVNSREQALSLMDRVPNLKSAFRTFQLETSGMPVRNPESTWF